jgi:hypothetical protein
MRSQFYIRNLVLVLIVRVGIDLVALRQDTCKEVLANSWTRDTPIRRCGITTLALVSNLNGTNSVRWENCSCGRSLETHLSTSLIAMSSFLFVSSMSAAICLRMMNLTILANRGNRLNESTRAPLVRAPNVMVIHG